MFKVGDIVERIKKDTFDLKVGDRCEVVSVFGGNDNYINVITKSKKLVELVFSENFKLVENKIEKKEEIKMNKELNLPKKYIIKKDATVLIWENGEKTIVKRTNEDNFDKRLGFLYAYFQKTSGLSRNKANKYIEELVEEKTKEQIKEEKIMKRINDMINTLVEKGILIRDTTEILE